MNIRTYHFTLSAWKRIFYNFFSLLRIFVWNKLSRRFIRSRLPTFTCWNLLFFSYQREWWIRFRCYLIAHTWATPSYWHLKRKFSGTGAPNQSMVCQLPCEYIFFSSHKEISGKPSLNVEKKLKPLAITQYPPLVLRRDARRGSITRSSY